LQIGVSLQGFTLRPRYDQRNFGGVSTGPLPSLCVAVILVTPVLMILLLTLRFRLHHPELWHRVDTTALSAKLIKSASASPFAAGGYRFVRVIFVFLALNNSHSYYDEQFRCNI
jgi:hypothetical protein